MISQRDLVQRLSRTTLGGWSVVERVQDLAIADERRSLQRRDHRIRRTLIVHQDTPRGRGSARLDVDAYDTSAEDLVDQATALALAAVGPAWSSAPPSAPAKVNIVDEDLLKRELDAIALSTLTRLHRPDGVTVTAATEILRERATVITSSGFHTTWLATTLHAHALLTTTGDRSSIAADRLSATAADHAPTTAADHAPTTAGDRPVATTGDRSSTHVGDRPPAAADRPSTPAAERTLTLSREARRTDDFDLDTAIAAAAAALLLLATAGPPTPGPCALWLGPEALLHGDASRTGLDFGLWTIFALQADSAVERQGLTRYRWRSEIAPGAASLAEPLTILSKGALDFATRSTPISDDAVATRNFPLIERGIAVGLGLSPREAALRHTDPNGGVRNLSIAPGTWSPAPAPTTRTIEVRRLRSLTIDPYTGDAVLDIALALDHRPHTAIPTPFTGGTLRLDLVTALALARRSANLLRRGAYHGPASVFIDDAELIA